MGRKSDFLMMVQNFIKLIDNRHFDTKSVRKDKHSLEKDRCNMTNEKKSEFYLVREEILPEAIKKTIMVKEILKRGKLKTVNEAVAKVGLSRSAYYKYKDYVFPFYDASREKVITISLLLEHKPGVLSSVLNTIAADGGSVITINQGVPLQGVANTTISVETKFLTIDMEALLDKVRLIEGVKRLDVLGQVD